MNINIDYQSRIPIYEQIVSEIEKLVALDILSPGSQIPSIRDLACNLSVNPNTVKKAYDILEQLNVIISKSTKGTFITDNVDKVKRIMVDKIIDDIKKNIEQLENIGVNKEDIIKKLKVSE